MIGGPGVRAALSKVIGTLLFLIVFVSGRFALAAVTGEALRSVALLAELSVAVALAGAAIAMLRVHVVVAAVFLLLASVFHTGNMEMVRALRTVIPLQTVSYATGSVFLQGSALESAYWWYGLCLAAASLVFLAVWMRDRARMIWPALTCAFIAIGIAFILTPFPLYGSSWTDGSLIWRSLATSLTREGPATFGERADAGPGDADTERFHPTDEHPAGAAEGPREDRPEELAGQIPEASRESHPNVLLVVIEGMAGAYLRQAQEYTGVRDPVVMDHLSRIGEELLIFPNTLAPNQQTIRGLYALLTGDYPRLDFSTPKVYEYMGLPENERPRPLPEVLRRAGYRTTYLQAADLSYMSKDQMMEEMGFEKSIGREHFEEAYAVSRWGPDDKAFFEQSLAYIKDHDRAGESPWFVTLLNVGSHHPYTVPEDFASKYPDERTAAVHYLDEALGDFYEGLQQEGILDDTLLVVISDESHGVDGHPYGQYWIVGMIGGPGIEAGIDTRRVSQIDIPVTILSHLGFENVPRVIPRPDMLDPDAAEADRVVVFGRFFSPRPDTVYELFQDGRVRAYDPGPGLFSNDYTPVVLGEEDASMVFRDLESWRHQEDFYHDFDRARPRRFSLIDDGSYTLSAGVTRSLSTGQFLSVPADSIATLTLVIEAPDSADATTTLGLQLVQDGGTEVTVPELPDLSLEPGERLEYSFSFDTTEPLSMMWTVLTALYEGEQGAVRVKVPRFELATRPGSLPAGFRLERFHLHPGSAPDGAPVDEPQKAPPEEPPRLPPVAHAGGSVRGEIYTNSIEALRANSDHFDLFELDFVWTADDRLIGLHDWDIVYERFFGPAPEEPLSYDDARRLETPAGASPLTLRQLSRFLEDRSDARIITDTKERTLDSLEFIRRQPGLSPDRFIPQIYRPDQAGPVREMGYPSFIWTLYRYPRRRDLRAVLGEVRSLRDRYGETFMAVTMPIPLAESGFARAVTDLGIPVYVHTINDREEAERMFALGAAGIYTDRSSVPRSR